MKHAFLMVSAILVLAIFGCSPQAANRPPVWSKAEVSFLDGTATANGKTLAVGDSVLTGMLVATDGTSTLELKVGNRNIIQLKPGTALRLNFEKPIKEVELLSGAVACVFKSLLNDGRSNGYVMRTGNTVAGVRGTSFFGRVIDETTTYVCTCNGTLYMETGTAATGSPQSEELASAHHAARIIRTQNGVTTSEPAGMEYHGDEEIEALALKVGHTVDWTKPD